MKNLEMLYELCDLISEEIVEANEKIRKAGGKLSAGDIDYIDKLTHTLKSLKTTIAMEEAESGEYSNADGVYMRGGSYARDGRRTARRDGMGRYSRRGYSRDGGGVKHMLQDAMEEATTEREREAIHRAMMEIER